MNQPSTAPVALVTGAARGIGLAIARWFLMCVLTSRYTGAGETQVEKDIRRFTDATTGPEFLGILDQIINSQLTDDYWE